ncbi:MAG: hypothetical protein KQ78_01607 [Candidatus Izimaplasma bacterium HR2]|nr:MAG: hypothetical protein KQ78_01607 [Candidatus Izimaplasma bacterium HR2]
MLFLSELIEIIFYLGLTLTIEVLVLLGLGYLNKKFIKTLVLINLATSPIYSALIAIYYHLFDSEMGIVLVLILEAIIIVIEFYVILKYLKEKYSKVEILITVVLVNGFSFLLAEFIRYTLDYFDVFPLF